MVVESLESLLGAESDVRTEHPDFIKNGDFGESVMTWLSLGESTSTFSWQVFVVLYTECHWCGSS